MLGDATTPSAISDGSALSISSDNHAAKVSATRRQSKRPYCDHCNKPGHTHDTCWQIHGKPSDWKPRKASSDQESRGNLVSPPLFNKEQLELLQSLISQSQQASQSSLSNGNALTIKGGQGLGEDDWQC
ncbi:hypothetical protein Sjap_015579 [Stephania japonica]|uniref:Uncharacterized protein n=1 Tax=Stephania japonica TaxID=461633 RepID=A0AAP0NQZ5_9MAGN